MVWYYWYVVDKEICSKFKQTVARNHIMHNYITTLIVYAVPFLKPIIIYKYCTCDERIQNSPSYHPPSP